MPAAIKEMKEVKYTQEEMMVTMGMKKYNKFRGVNNSEIML